MLDGFTLAERNHWCLLLVPIRAIIVPYTQATFAVVTLWPKAMLSATYHIATSTSHGMLTGNLETTNSHTAVSVISCQTSLRQATLYCSVLEVDFVLPRSSDGHTEDDLFPVRSLTNNNNVIFLCSFLALLFTTIRRLVTLGPPPFSSNTNNVTVLSGTEDALLFLPSTYVTRKHALPIWPRFPFNSLWRDSCRTHLLATRFTIHGSQRGSDYSVFCPGCLFMIIFKLGHRYAISPTSRLTPHGWPGSNRVGPPLKHVRSWRK